MNLKKFRVFIGLQEISGYYANLKKGFRELGVDCTFVDLTANHRFGYDGDDKNNFLVRWFKWFSQYRERIPKENIFTRQMITWLRNLLKCPIFLWVLIRYDVFIFGYTSSFFAFKDIPLLKFFKKKIIYVFHGTDSRPPYLNGFLINSRFSVDQIIQMTQSVKEKIRIIEKYADVIVNHPPMAQFLERPFVMGYYIGIPFNSPVSELKQKPARLSNSIRILHCPSNPEAKGTHIIRRAIDVLKSKGYEIEYIELINQHHSVVLDNLQECDFIIDQSFSDTSMAGFAAEAAFFGKPAIVGGYYANQIARDYPPEIIPPSHFCHPDEIETAVEKLIVDEKYRLELGKQAQSYVYANWTPKRVAEHFLMLVNGEIPQEWLYNPRNICFFYGAGAHESYLRDLVRNAIEKGGTDALQLRDKPELEQMLVRWAGLASTGGR